MRLKTLITLLAVLLTSFSAYAFKPIELGEGHYLKFFYDAQFGYTGRNTGSGPEGEESTSEFNFRRNRLGFIGTYNSKLSFYVQTEYIEDKNITPLSVDVSDDDSKNFYLLDAQLRYKMNKNIDLILGKFKHSLTRENLEGCFTPLTMDRSYFVYAPFKTSRDKGIGIRASLADNLMQLRFEAQEGRTGDEGDGSPDPASNLRYTARAHISLGDKEKGYGYKGTYLGKKKVLTVGASYQMEPEAVYADTVNQTDAKDYKAYSFDIFGELPTAAGTFTASAAYLDVQFDEAYQGANPDFNSYGMNGERDGYYVKGAYMLPGKIGPGQLQLFARYDTFNYAMLNGFYDNTIDFYAGGVNYYLDEDKIKIAAQYGVTDFEEELGSNTNMQDFDTFELYLQVRF
ncbi:selenite/tellurite reduction operon porin ExtI [Limisalsivibrio acetivorans]|uniref:selenite/tellurite reduction operon porin ExtI n=1 Tax=Limisalsivibrio acetivorans TaxID=1304888 RepID=UPI0003B7B76F|nr:selenite/tellurite reduction operon porin ExtI [Limisalsivibrio acetivorans]